MATINSTSTTAGSYNYVNLLLEHEGRRIAKYTDRKVSATYDRGALIERITGLVQEATRTNPFVNATS